MDQPSTAATVENFGTSGTHTSWQRSLVLNVRAVVLSILIVAVVAPLLYAVHAMQVKKNAGALFERAEELEKNGDLEGASQALYKYLTFRPDDGAARVRLARVFDKTAVAPTAKERATEHYAAALGYFPDQHDLRVRMAELLLELRRPKEAEDECLRVLFGTTDVPQSALASELKRYHAPLERARLLTDKPEAASALRLLALARYQRLLLNQAIRPSDLCELVKGALATNERDIELTTALAELYRDHLDSPSAEQRAIDADELMALLVDSHPTPAKAQLALYRYRLKYELADIDEPLKRAVELDPNNLEVLLVAGARAHTTGRFKEAEERYRQVIKISPKVNAGYAGLARTALAEKRPADAIAACKAGFKEVSEEDFSLNLLYAQALLADRKFDEAKKTIDEKLRPQLERMGPTRSVAQRTQLRDAVASLEAEHATATGDVMAAIAIVKRMAIGRSAELSVKDDFRVRAHNWNQLGLLYGQAGYWELAARAFEEQAQLEDDAYRSLVDAANAWHSAGRLDVAIDTLKKALKSKEATADGWARMAELEFERAARTKERDWTRFDESYAAASAKGSSAKLVMLDVQKKSIVGQIDQAVETLNANIEKYPDELLPFAVLFAQSIGRSGESDGYLQQLRTAWPQRTVDVALIESELWRRRKQPQKARELIEKSTADADSTQRYRVLQQLATIDAAGDPLRAAETLSTMAKEYPQDLWPLEQLAEIALTQNDLDSLQKYEQALKRLEGNEGSLWRFYRGMRLARLSSGLNEAQAQELIRLDQELTSLRPSWPATHQLHGQMLQQRGRVAEAAEAYQRAISLGARNVSLFEGLVAILYANNQISEADLFLNRLQDIGYQSPGLEALTPRILLRAGEYEQAVAAARTGVRLRPNDALAQNWLGQTLAIAAEKQESTEERQKLLAEAEEALKSAVKLSPENHRTWSALLWFYGRNNRQRANALLQEVSHEERLSELDRILTLGQAYQFLGNFTEAEKHLQKAVELRSKDPRVHMLLARLYQSYAPEKVEPVLRRLLEIDPNSADARRVLAAHLASQGLDVKFDEAVELLQSGNTQIADKRLRAALLVRRKARGDLDDARRLLNDLLREDPPDPTDTLLLAIVNEIDGRIPDAEALLRQLIAQSNNPTFAAALVEFLLRNNLLAEAESEVARLERLDPNSLRTLSIKSRWRRAAQHPVQEISRDIEEHRRQAAALLADKAELLRVQASYALLYSKLDMKQQAENVFRELLKQEPAPQVLQSFVAWLANEGRTKDAVRVCLDIVSANSTSARNVQILTNVLTWGAARGENYPEAEERLASLVADRKEDPSLLLDLGTLRHMQGRLQEAEDLYQKALTLQPTNALIRNNLAMLFIERSDTAQQAVPQIEQAIHSVGSAPELRDTYALVLARNGKAEDAKRILQSLVTQSPRVSRYQFHLAVVEQQLANKQEAAHWLETAKKNRLSDELMTPIERTMLYDLEKSLNSTANDSPSKRPSDNLGANRGT